MNDQRNATPDNWSALLDELKLHEGIGSDAQLAASLGVTRGFICSVRKGRKGLSLKLAESILARLGRPLDTKNLELLFVPRIVRSRVQNIESLRLELIASAGGLCQLCRAPAPFIDRNGVPFLEIHHIVPACDGGVDELFNMVALCPNCHRRMQYAATETDLKTLRKIAKKFG